MKHTQRLDYARLAEVLHERGMADPAALGELLQSSAAGGAPFAEALVNAGIVGDWDLSRIVCEIFNLPFLPLDVCPPDIDASDGLDQEFLVQNGLVPVTRFGQVLTLSMPGLVPADVLGLMSAMSDLVILPVVGTVQTNRRWLEENMGEKPEPILPSGMSGMGDSDWKNLFDDADAAVQSELDGSELEIDEPIGALPVDDDQALEVEGLESDLEFGDFEVAPASLEDYEVDEDFDTPSSSSPAKSEGSAKPSSSSGSGLDLPPMPEFE